MNLFPTCIRTVCSLAAATGLFAFLTLTQALSAQIQAQPNVVNMDIRSKLDAVGDGEMTITLRMNASEWAAWKRQYGTNPSMFKRDICKMFTQYELTKFDLVQDDMERQATVKIRGKALSAYEGEGVYEVELGKTMAKGDLVDGEYRVTYTEPQGPNSLSLIDQRIRLPEGAHHAEIATSAAGVPVLRYLLEPAGTGLPWLWIGAALLAIAAGLVFASTRIKQPNLQAVTQFVRPGTMAS